MAKGNFKEDKNGKIKFVECEEGKWDLLNKLPPVNFKEIWGKSAPKSNGLTAGIDPYSTTK